MNVTKVDLKNVHKIQYKPSITSDVNQKIIF